MNKEWNRKHSHFTWNIVFCDITENTENQNQFIDLSELWTNTKYARGRKKKTTPQPEESPEEGTEVQKIKTAKANASLPSTRKCSTMIKKQSTNNKRNCVILLWKSLSKT